MNKGSDILRRLIASAQRVPPLVWLLVVVLIAYAPGIFFGRAFFEFDSLTEGYAYSAHFASHAGDWRGGMYTNAYHSGANMLHNPDIGLFGLLMTFIPSGISEVAFWNLITAVFFALFVIVSYAFFRAHGFEPATAATLAAFVGFGQRYMTYFSSWIWVAVYTIFPATCLVIKRYADTGRAQWVAAGGIVVAFSAFFAQPGILVFLTIPLGAYAIFLAVRAFRSGWTRGMKFIFGGMGMVAFGLLLSGWYVFPTMRMAGDTPRAGGISFADAQTDALRFTDIPQIILPHWSLYTSTEAMLYMASLGILFALLSLVRRAEHAEIRFWRWLFLACVLFAVPYSPLAWAANQLPVWNSARVPTRVLFAATFAVALLAGTGLRLYFHSWDELRRSRMVRALRAFLAVTLGLLGAGALFAAMGGFVWVEQAAVGVFDRFLAERTTGLPTEHYHRVIASMIARIRDMLSLTNPLTLWILTGLGTAVTVLFRIRPLPRAAVLCMLFVLSVGYGVGTAWHVQRVSAEQVTQDSQAAMYIRFQPDAHLFRAFTLFYGSSKFELLDTPALGAASPEDQFTYARDLLAVNTNLRHGVQSIDGYDNFATLRTSDLLNEMLSETMPTGNRISRSNRTRVEKISLFEERLNVLGMMNVKWVVSAYELPTSTLSVAWEGRTTSLDIPFRIYENPLVLPRVYFAQSVKWVSSGAALTELFTPGRDFRRETLVECAECGVAEDFSADGSERVEITLYTPGDVRIRTSAAAARMLVFSENYLHGWIAIVDEIEVPIHAANHVYQAVLVPEGDHEVRFHYRGP